MGKSKFLNIPYSPSRLDSTQFFRNRLKKYLKKNTTVIDVGCGKLFFYNLLLDLHYKIKYFGIDIEPIKEIHSTKLISAKTKRVDFLQFKTKEKFDFAACLWVLEHIKKDEKALKHIHSLLKRNGILFLALPSIYSWPFEFGRHGLHYYSKKDITQMALAANFQIIESYQASGATGLIFMILYNWPRFLLLIPCLILYKLGKSLGVVQSSWRSFSSSFINKTLYRYHKSDTGLNLHNKIVESIVQIDNTVKVFPSSYILILKKVN